MSLLTDLRAVSENAIEQIAARFSELPRPLLAAIGAGDMAVERWADLRESLAESLGGRVSAGPFEGRDIRSAAADLPTRAQKAVADLPTTAQQAVADLPGKAQKAAAELAATFEQLAADVPVKAQVLIDQLPDLLAEFQAAAQSLSPDVLKDTVEAYTQLVAMIYGSLADRGDNAWSKVGPAHLHPGLIVDPTGTPAKPTSAKAAEKRAATARAAAATAAARAPRAEVKRAVTAQVTEESATRRPRGPKTGAAKPAAPATPKPAAAPATPKPAAAPATPRSTAKPATPSSTAKPRTPKSTARPTGPGADLT